MTPNIFCSFLFVFLLHALPLGHNIFNAHLTGDLLFNFFGIRHHQADLTVIFLGQYIIKLGFLRFHLALHLYRRQNHGRCVYPGWLRLCGSRLFYPVSPSACTRLTSSVGSSPVQSRFIACITRSAAVGATLSGSFGISGIGSRFRCDPQRKFLLHPGQFSDAKVLPVSPPQPEV